MQPSITISQIFLKMLTFWPYRQWKGMPLQVLSPTAPQTSSFTTIYFYFTCWSQDQHGRRWQSVRELSSVACRTIRKNLTIIRSRVLSFETRRPPTQDDPTQDASGRYSSDVASSERNLAGFQNLQGLPELGACLFRQCLYKLWYCRCRCWPLQLRKQALLASST
ncbi:hypothetical protein C7460_1494 [Marinoscillum furvescens DSM 4134]|uniref:Uncharacterized protein n=1 Tax=Marinoscillum furvescens DSM 4134 TaxID=1122208 RepID=A0A3D9KXP3_MARFU|nr:hypothetical protein C7460_1494 [Marinoscillum furvescens DSM 4134]